MFIMIYIAFRKHRNFNSALLTVFYRDGIFYFICLSGAYPLWDSIDTILTKDAVCTVLAAGNIIVNLAAPDGGFKFLLVQCVFSHLANACSAAYSPV